MLIADYHLLIADYYLLPLDENRTGSDTAILGSIPIPAQNDNNEFQVSMIWDFHSSFILWEGFVIYLITCIQIFKAGNVASLIADSVVVSLILARTHTFAVMGLDVTIAVDRDVKPQSNKEDMHDKHIGKSFQDYS